MRSETSELFCLSCGYDLRGLEMPRACPECGRLRDPVKDEQTIREWFATTWCGFDLFLPKRCPLGVWYLLENEDARRIAKRRRFMWLWLPAILAFAVVAPTCFISIDKDVHGWYYDASDPTRKPLRYYDETDNDRIFGFNIALFSDIFFTKPPNWIEVRERNYRSVTVGDFEIDGVAVVCGGIPLIAVIVGYYPVHFALFLLALFWRRTDVPRARFFAPTSLLATTLGIVLWVWLVFLLIHLVFFLVRMKWGGPTQAFILLLLLTGAYLLWVILSLTGWYSLFRADNARRVFARRRSASIAAGLFCSAMPLLFWIFLCNLL